MTTSTTTAVVAHRADDVRVDSVPVRSPEPHEAVVALAYGGICGSDLHYWRHGAVGESVLRAPMVLGHEVVGTVLRAAADGTGPAAGTEVAVHPARHEDTDVRFPRDRPNLSPGVRYLGSAARFPHTEGAFAREVVLPAAMLRALPEGIDLRIAALAEPAAVAWHAVSQAGDLAGKRVLVVGSGPIGALAVAVAARAGAAEIVAVDLHTKPREIAAEVGATRTLDAADAEGIAAVDADVVIESSGNHRGLASAIAGATRGGTVVMVGLLPGGDQPVPIAQAISRELRMVGSFRFNDEIDEVIAAIADGSLPIGPVITHSFPLDETLEALAVAADASVSGKVLLAFREGDG
ncbi:zinc-binding dehydrogenase [Streptomyces sp. NBC_01186]|uniref:zinc-binding dehydrogenase n=1 Tax=unclassified Streptomyces TaxID=2593676 RepID=UPI002DDA687C|nr:MULTISPECIES: zinc-binding dehydrogenase [unclassified Streptomyces]WSB74557.1 zinc-binding dehydrogenase [Streptomyces sp. NBC_01775]WSS17059.1 zinc-binding dehydrogenase [Streptomyces sp. NBC_01186]